MEQCLARRGNNARPGQRFRSSTLNRQLKTQGPGRPQNRANPRSPTANRLWCLRLCRLHVVCQGRRRKARLNRQVRPWRPGNRWEDCGNPEPAGQRFRPRPKTHRPLPRPHRRQDILRPIPGNTNLHGRKRPAQCPGLQIRLPRLRRLRKCLQVRRPSQHRRPCHR
jgi:hypothetical protein